MGYVDGREGGREYCAFHGKDSEYAADLGWTDVMDSWKEWAREQDLKFIYGRVGDNASSFGVNGWDGPVE